jgi:periplasmic divalent cation tolerance protein
MTKEFDLVYTTLPSVIVAQRFASAIVEQKLARCVNIIPAIISVYQWNNNIEQAQESVLLIKTFKKEQVMQWIKDNHPYELPAIFSLEAETY